MKLESLSIKNYRVFQDIQIRNMPGLCVFVGANGSGKSTLFDVFGFLKDALAGNVRTALQKRGALRRWSPEAALTSPSSSHFSFDWPSVV